MSSSADRTIAALTNEHTSLADIAASITDEQLTAPSGASEWALHRVFSHLGSGAEITLAGLQAALGAPAPDEGFNQSVWDRWDASSPREQLDGFVTHDAALIAALEALDETHRAELQLELGFLPFPLSVASFAGMRLNEVAQHSWDVRVALDPAAGIAVESARVLVEQYSEGLGFMLGFIGKADQLDRPTVVDVHGFGLTIADSVALTAAPVDATAVFSGPLEAAVRLLGGRLTAAHTPADVGVTGNVTLEDLRRVFPGY